MIARSYLYVPADRLDRLEKARTRSADALIVDLEDSIPPRDKQRVREQLVGWLTTSSGPVWIRVNSGSLAEGDIRAVARYSHVVGICLAKAETVADVERASSILAEVGSTAVIAPLLESAAAILDSRAIASGPRVTRLQIGEADLCADLGILPSSDGRELAAIRGQVVLASAAARIGPPVAAVSANYTDLAALKESTESLRRMGFFGRTCIHPAQLAVVNDVFTPTSAEVAAAKAVLARLDAVSGAATTAADGSMIDEAFARAARDVVQLSEAVGTRPAGADEAPAGGVRS
jgi:citrate lyase subunit beta/citryl-CoA lyase